MAAFAVGIVAIVLGIVFRGVNVSFLVGWAFAVAASANLPAILMLLFWKKTTAAGIVASITVGIISALGIILTGPAMFAGPYGLRAEDALAPPRPARHHLDPAQLPHAGRSSRSSRRRRPRATDRRPAPATGGQRKAARSPALAVHRRDRHPGLEHLGRGVARSTVAKVLREHGIKPAPDRPTSWRSFLQAHADVLVAADFFTTEVWTARGLVTHYTLFVIDLASPLRPPPGLRLTSPVSGRPQGTSWSRLSSLLALSFRLFCRAGEGGRLRAGI
jgi:hypothetical protein